MVNLHAKLARQSLRRELRHLVDWSQQRDAWGWRDAYATKFSLAPHAKVCTSAGADSKTKPQYELAAYSDCW